MFRFRNIQCSLFNKLFYKVSKNIANFYACWDLMEITTLSNLLALTSQLSGIDYSLADAKFSEEAFTQLVKTIFMKINVLQKWVRNGMVTLVAC